MDISKLICKNCGAPFEENELIKTTGVITCKYCRNVFTIPTKNKKVMDLLLIGENQLDLGHFDDAFNTFLKAKEDAPEEAEVYFDLALAEFKVQYLKDEINNTLQPICHEIKESSFVKNKNYLKALSLATPEAKEEYIKKANDIDRINDEFYRLKESNINYDTFICVKVTDENGNKTPDYAKACQIYMYLTKKGYNPFFSEFSLVNEVGSDYEAHILYALKNSPSMLIICSNEEYLQTKWVRNEYKRFINFIENEEKNKNSIAILFKESPIEKIPGRKGKLQGIDLDNISAIELVEKFINDNKNVNNEQESEADKLRKELEEIKESLKNKEDVQINEEPKQEEPKVDESSRDLEDIAQNNSNNKYSLKLISHGPLKLNTIKVVKTITGLGLKEAEFKVNNLPSIILDNVDISTLRSAANILHEVGAKYEIVHGTVSSTSKTNTSNTKIEKSTILFGSYYNKNNENLEPIKWDILAEKDGKALIITHNIIDSKAFLPKGFYKEKGLIKKKFYNISSGAPKDIYANNYEYSYIRSWLNGDFYNKAFNDQEKKQIQTTLVDNSLSTTGDASNEYVCKNTKDNIFILSEEEVVKYYSDDNSRKASGTEYALEHKLWVKNGTSFWWLRTPGRYNSNRVRYVFFDGNTSATDVEYSVVGVRPACWIKLDNNSNKTSNNTQKINNQNPISNDDVMASLEDSIGIKFNF